MPVNAGRVRVGRSVHSERMHMMASNKRRLNVVSTGRTLGGTRREGLSLIGVSPGTGPPIYGVVSCNGCHFRRSGHRGRGEGGRHIVRVGRVHLSLGVSARSFRAGIGRTRGFLGTKGGIGISVHFENHRVTRPRVNRISVGHFTRTYRRFTAIRGPTGLRKHRVLVFLTPGT